MPTNSKGLLITLVLCSAALGVICWGARAQASPDLLRGSHSVERVQQGGATPSAGEPDIGQGGKTAPRSSARPNSRYSRFRGWPRSDWVVWISRVLKARYFGSGS
jgi:hypothetical protein